MIQPRRALPALLAVAAVVPAVGCGDTVSHQELERKIAAFVHDQTGTTVTVHCPKDVTAKKGTRTTCETTLSGARTMLDVVFTTDRRFRVSTRLITR